MLVVGAGPAGSAAAAWAARRGLDVLLADAAVFPRDKTCGDGLTPRAIAELERLGPTSRLVITVSATNPATMASRITMPR